jgi:hypothetical protein
MEAESDCDDTRPTTLWRDRNWTEKCIDGMISLTNGRGDLGTRSESESGRDGRLGSE